MQMKTRINFSKRTRQIMIMVMIVASLVMGGVMTAMAAPPAQTGTVTVTVADTTGALQSGLPVYAFSGTTYTGQNATTNGAGQVSFTLASGTYNFRSDLNGTQFFSGGASGVNTCTVPTPCTADSVTVTTPVVVTVENTDNIAQAGLNVYAFNGTTYSGKSGVTNAAGQVSLTLLPGNYNFRADFNGTQFFSGGAAGVNTCDVPSSGLICTADSVSVTIPVVVTVLDTNSTPQSGVSVYAFNGTTYSGKSGVTNAAGEVSLTLLPGNYNFRADFNGTQFFSGGTAGNNTCTVPGCTADSVMVTLPVIVTVADTDSTPQSGVSVYAFNGTTYSGKTGVTNASGEVSFTLVPGNYNFRADFNGTQFFSGGASGVNTCNIPSVGLDCTADLVTVTSAVVVTVNDSIGYPQEGLPVYAFNGTTYSGKSGISDVNGQVSFTLVPGDYNFRADLNGSQYFSGGSSGVNTCTIPGCLADTVVVPTTAVTLPASTCTLTSPGNRTCDLWATTGTLFLPNGSSVPIWGYADTAGGAAQLPGPMLIVNQGETITINLTNNLTEATSMYFPGIPMQPDLIGAAGTGGTTSYTFVANEPGTYRYEAGLLPNAQHQVAMGMYGAFIVRPVDGTPILNQAYADASTAFFDEALVLLSEIDPNLNNSADPAAFDMRNYKPKYWLINGQAYPNTQPIPTAAGNKLLLRYINAGSQYHTMSLMGLDQMLLAEDGNPLPYQRSVVAESIMIGQTRDMIVNVLATMPDGSKLALYDANMLLHNNNAAGFGGMMTFITTADGPVGPDVVGPTTNAVAVTPSPTDGTVDVSLTATVSDVATGNANIAAAEYYIDDTNGTANVMSGAFASPAEAVVATIPAATVAALSPGDHIIYVRGQDALGNWGSFNLVTLRLELTGSGPTTKSLTLTPNPSAGDVIVALSGTADDRATGNNNIALAEFFIGAPGTDGSGTPMTINVDGPIASIDYDLTVGDLSGYGEGLQTVYVHSQDSFGFWGAMATIDLAIDLSGPNTSNVTIAPNPNNGTLPVNPSMFAARLDATINDPVSSQVQSNVYKAEFFINATCDDGTGIPMYARDGVFDSPTEEAYALISLVNINALGPGSHDILVHGRDNSGNWGPCSSTTLVIEQGVPTVSGTAATPNPTNGATAVDLTAVANDAGSTITQAEWFADADPGPGNGTAMTISGANPWNLSANIDITGWADGSYTLYTRARDAAGNWSLADSTVLVVDTPLPAAVLYFSTSGNVNPPGVTGTADNADIYSWNGTTFSRMIDASGPGSLGLPGGANVIGFVPVDATRFYMSFSGANTNVPGLGNVQDEDVVYYDNGVWSVYFDGTAQGLTAGGQDLDAVSIVGGILYFSTSGNVNPTGVTGAADDADIYSWNGTSFARVWDASANGLPGGADVDGLKFIDATHFYVSFNSANTNVPGLGNVQDEDIVYNNNGSWTVHFDGTAQGLTAGGHDLDAFYIP